MPQRELQLWERLGLAGLSNAIGASCTNPLDVVKVRLQLDRALDPAKRPYTNMMTGLVHIGKSEGVRGLWSGLGPAMAREMSYSSIRLGLYEPFKRLLGETDRRHTPLHIKLAAGAASGVIGSALATPTDLLKIRAQGGVSYDGFVSTASRIVREEGGVSALWQGVGPNVQRAALLTACQVPGYDHAKHALLNAGWMQDGWQCHCAASGIAGFVTAVVTAPVDTIKSRVMNQKAEVAKAKAAGKEAPALYRGLLDAAARITRAEGPMALYRGFFPNWMRIAPHTTISLMAFEGFRVALGVKAM